jgi:hypothetical protein
MSAVVIAGDTSGAITLQAPAVSGTTTVTIPATTGNFLLDTTTGVCRAWVNFNGTGTVAIRASYNVSSITDNGAGDYTVNFTTAMPDTNYCLATQSYSSGSGTMSCGIGDYSSNGTMNTNNCRIYVAFGTSATKIDANVLSIAFFR